MERADYSLDGKTEILYPKINGYYYSVLVMTISRFYKKLKKWIITYQILTKEYIIPIEKRLEK